MVKIRLYWLPGSRHVIYMKFTSETSEQMLFKILVKVFLLELLPKSITELKGSFRMLRASLKHLPIAVHTGEDRCVLTRLRLNLWMYAEKDVFHIQVVFVFL